MGLSKAKLVKIDKPGQQQQGQGCGAQSRRLRAIRTIPESKTSRGGSLLDQDNVIVVILCQSSINREKFGQR